MLENHHPGKEVGQAFQPSLTYNVFRSCRGHGVINEAGCWNYLVGMTLGPSTFPRYERVGGPFRAPISMVIWMNTGGGSVREIIGINGIWISLIGAS